MNFLSEGFKAYTSVNLVTRIIVGICVGAIFGVAFRYGVVEGLASFIGIFGKLFVSALKAVAPILVFVLIASSIMMGELKNIKGLRYVMYLYVIGTFIASVVGVGFSFLFPTEIVLVQDEVAVVNAPSGLGEVLTNVLLNIISNPVDALANANYMGILAWGIAFGVLLRTARVETKNMFEDFSNAITKVVRFVIEFAPFGVMGLIAISIYETGKDGLLSYAKITILLVCAMLFLALVVNPLITWLFLKKNPYPLVLKTLKESGITAFFTRSSAANIPVNLNLCKKLDLDEDLYSISIPLGATINMGGAAVVIAILTLSTAFSLGVEVSFFSSLLLCLVATIAACGASGVAGGSLMLIPLACSLFNIPGETAAQVIAIGVMIGVIQDSLETAINSSTDVLFTAIATYKTTDKEFN
ncbi:MAG: serine/threonine transporter SstT [Campylobacter sp.]|nr:serine/threonine transporter SstT [Campylobacter sp.]